MNRIPVRVTTRSAINPRPQPLNTNNTVLLSQNVNKPACNRILAPVKKETALSMLKCGLINCRSVNNWKTATCILNQIKEEKLDCVALTETWLSANEEENNPALARLVPDDWTMLHIPRTTHAGGVGFMCQKHFSPKLDKIETAKKFTSFEYQIVLMTFHLPFDLLCCIDLLPL